MTSARRRTGFAEQAHQLRAVAELASERALRLKTHEQHGVLLITETVARWWRMRPPSHMHEAAMMMPRVAPVVEVARSSADAT